MTPLTLESLARAIHEDATLAVGIVDGSIVSGQLVDGWRARLEPFDALSARMRAIRREQARLMLERIMR